MPKNPPTYEEVESLIYSNYIDYFRQRILNADSAIAVSILGSMDSILKESFYRLGYNLNIAYLKCLGASINGIHFCLDMSLSKGADSFKVNFLKENNISESLFLEVVNNDTILRSAFSQTINRELDILELGNIIGIKVDNLYKNNYRNKDISNINFYLPLSNFPNIKKEIDEFFLLEEKNNLYYAEKSRITSEYELDRFPYVLISDVEYSVAFFEIERLTSQRNEINSKILKLVKKIEERKEKLYSEDSINMKKVDEIFKFDEDRYLILKEYIQYSLKNR